MKALNLFALTIGFGLFIGSWMPLAVVHDGSYYMNPTHTGGLTYLVYVIPFLLAGTAIYGLVKTSVNTIWWLFGIALFSVIVIVASIFISLEQLSLFLSLLPGGKPLYLVPHPPKSAMAMIVAVGILGIVCILYAAAKPQIALLSHTGKTKPDNASTTG